MVAASSPNTTVLVHLWGNQYPTDAVRAQFPEVTFVHVHPEGPIPEEVAGNVCFTLAAHSQNLVELLERGVQWIHAIGHGVDHFPLESLGNRVLTSARGASAVPIAEWVVAMLLTAVKQLPEKWVTEPPERWLLADLGTLEGAKVALLGFGSINRAVADRLEPFGCELVAATRTHKPRNAGNVAFMTDVTTAVADADHVVVGTPLTHQTENMVNEELLAAMKPGAHLINIARGRIIDEVALRKALDTGQIGLASLDVCDPEPLPVGHWLYSHPSVRLSPHVSWSSPRGLQRLHDSFTDNLQRWQAGEPLADVVDIEAGY